MRRRRNRLFLKPCNVVRPQLGRIRDLLGLAVCGRHSCHKDNGKGGCSDALERRHRHSFPFNRPPSITCAVNTSLRSLPVTRIIWPGAPFWRQMTESRMCTRSLSSSSVAGDPLRTTKAFEGRVGPALYAFEERPEACVASPWFTRRPTKKGRHSSWFWHSI